MGGGFFQKDWFSRNDERMKNVFLVTNDLVVRDGEVSRRAIDAEFKDLAI